MYTYVEDRGEASLKGTASVESNVQAVRTETVGPVQGTARQCRETRGWIP